MHHGELPSGLSLARTTDELTATTVPAGLLRAHRVASGVWGRLQVRGGRMRFVWEQADRHGPALELEAGDSVVIPPDVPHHVEPGDDARFVVEFHR
jgi:tellurite resistance-related uncharacterized protein